LYSGASGGGPWSMARRGMWDLRNGYARREMISKIELLHDTYLFLECSPPAMNPRTLECGGH
jgi:hypothetical protein